MSAIYGNRFSSMWGGIDPAAIKAEWGAALAGYGPDEIAQGLAGCRSRDWPPNLPEFLKLCRPPLDYDEMWRDCAAGVYRSAVAYWAAQKFGPYEVRNLVYTPDVRARWIKIAEDIRSKPDLPPVPDLSVPALPAPGKTYSPEKAARAVDAMRRMLRSEKDAA